MFTGIVTDLGTVTEIKGAQDKRLKIATAYDMASVDMGASISCSGCCLTVVEKGAGWFAVDVSAETLSKTTLGDWSGGTRVNLERALRMGDELGGHLVSGHVDGVGSVTAIRPDGGSLRYEIRVPDTLAKFIAPKGSVALDGVSLTVNEVADKADGTIFGVNIIPHTQSVTTFGTYKPGSRLNVEIDLMARYVARMLNK